MLVAIKMILIATTILLSSIFNDITSFTNTFFERRVEIIKIVLKLIHDRRKRFSFLGFVFDEDDSREEINANSREKISFIRRIYSTLEECYREKKSFPPKRRKRKKMDERGGKEWKMEGRDFRG